MQRADERDDVRERAPEPIELPDHERVAGAQHLEGAAEAGSVGDGPAAHVLVDALAAGQGQRVALQL